MNNTDKQYKELIEKILSEGHKHRDRTGIGTISIFGHQMRFNMEDGFPLLTLRKIHVKSMIHELLWFLGAYDSEWSKFGNCNVKYLNSMGVKFWNDWPYQEYNKRREYRTELPELSITEFEECIKNDDEFALEFGSIGKGYGKQWIDYGGKIENTFDEKGKNKTIFHAGVNQIDSVISQLSKYPDSRRIIVDAWKVDELDDMLLPPCHMMFQFNSYKMTPKERIYEFNKLNQDSKKNMDEINFPERRLNLQLYQRSVDTGLGLPFNISEYSLLLHMIAHCVNMIPYEFIWTGGDVHIYNNHIEQLKTLLERDGFDLPKLKLNENIKSIYDFRYEDIVIENYKAHPNIKMDVAV
jgi:thymidylate synthase